MERAIGQIEEELEHQIRFFKGEDKLLEAQRIQRGRILILRCFGRTGFCSGIENYSRHLTGLAEGEPPHTLLDIFRMIF